MITNLLASVTITLVTNQSPLQRWFDGCYSCDPSKRGRDWIRCEHDSDSYNARNISIDVSQRHIVRFESGLTFTNYTPFTNWTILQRKEWKTIENDWTGPRQVIINMNTTNFTTFTNSYFFKH